MFERFRNSDLLFVPVIVVGVGVIGFALDLPAYIFGTSRWTADGVGLRGNPLNTDDHVIRDAPALVDQNNTSDSVLQPLSYVATELERAAEAQAGDLRKQLDGERAHAAALERDLAGARQQAAQAGQDGAARDRKGIPSEVGVASRRPWAPVTLPSGASVPVEAIVGGAQMRWLKFVAARRVEEPGGRPSAKHAAVGTAVANVVKPGRPAAPADPPKPAMTSLKLPIPPRPAPGDTMASTLRTGGSSNLEKTDRRPTIEASTRNDLPDGASPHVLMRFERSSDAAVQRVAIFKQVLHDKGVLIADLIEVSAHPTQSAVSYFYAEDQLSAERIANALTATRPMKRYLPVGKSLPPPGTIEVAIAK